VPAGQKTGHGEPDGALLTDDDAMNVLLDPAE
jgi:hypothetical protein